MYQQVIVQTEATAELRPLLETAVRNERKLLAHGVRRTQDRLTAFEEQYSMSSGEFERRYTAGEVAETVDFIDWIMEIHAMRLLQEQYQALTEARFG